ncbi:MAG: hypothetical protein JSW61_00445 [Candidatus Thorarchaeota archaeon]|nr:MAG: hypothetical protein JSW61_00445 [Candidatus Thorarchaeota archaeon]
MTLHNGGIVQISGISGLVHVWGSAGSGKTLLAIRIASEAACHSHVLWVNTDGKGAFIRLLRKNVVSAGGSRANVSVVLGHSDARSAIDRISSCLKNETSLVVVDTITRILGMGPRSEPMWARVLFEEALPMLAGIARSRNIMIVILSESRSNGVEDQAVHLDSIKKFADFDLHVEREPGRRVSRILVTGKSMDSMETILALRLSNDGIVEVNPTSKDMGYSRRQEGCSEGHVSV